MNIEQATRDYERWLARHTPLISSELRRKHDLMRESPFPFLRGTFYRWAQIWPEVCRDLARAPRVLAVGDLHVENFGTWRDIEGRLVWGINDFDEAVPQAYTNDLVRLTTSALLAAQEDVLAVGPTAATSAILEGYTDGLREEGHPLLLGEKRKRLWAMAQGEMRAPSVFWRRMDSFKKLKKVPPQVRRALQALLPGASIKLTFAHRVAGVGSLGRQRYLALGEWRGGRIAREAKAMAPSAAVWAGQANANTCVLYQRLLNRAVRCPDPFVHLEGGWLVRRLSPDCSRIELCDLPVSRDEVRLLYCMGWETANIHLGTVNARSRIEADLKKRSAGWLLEAARQMVKVVVRDWKDWRRATAP
jgi:Uncharacterized protein conserved in bacteria (DUF2252)